MCPAPPFSTARVQIASSPNEQLVEDKPNWYSFDSMTEDEKPRSIRFPQRLWDAIDRDAHRCKRSAVKQMESVLSEYYGLASVDLDREKLKDMQAARAETPNFTSGQKRKNREVK